MYITGGMPARGTELGSIKFQNSTFSRRNFFTVWGHGCYCTEYHKARASTNLSYFVVRFLPAEVTMLLLYYITYIRPFANMVYREMLCKAEATVSDYLFCSDETPHKCWDGDILSKTLQEESEKHIGVKLNIWAYRQIILGIAKRYLKEIWPYFDKDDKAARKLQTQNPDSFMFAWMSAHMPELNITTYGLDIEFPCHLQPELMLMYLRIALLWHEFLKLIGLGEADIEARVGVVKRKRKMVDCEVQTMTTGDMLDPTKHEDEEEPEASQETKRLRRIIADATRMIKLRKEERDLRESLRI